MIKYLFSIGTETHFQALLLRLTDDGLNEIDEIDLNDIVKSFAGKDQQTRAQIAYAMLISKIVSSQTKHSSIYQLRNLIILDRLVDEKLFCQEIAHQSLQIIERLSLDEKSGLEAAAQPVARIYWKLVRQRAQLTANKQSILCYRNYQRKYYLQNLSINEVLAEISAIQHCFSLVFQLLDDISNSTDYSGFRLSKVKIKADISIQFLKSGLVNSILLRILYKLILYQSCQLLCNIRFMNLMVGGSEELISTFRRCLVKFNSNCYKFILFIQTNKHRCGFKDINYQELNYFQNKEILSIIDAILLEKKRVVKAEIQPIKLTNKMKMKVQIKPHANLAYDIVPRLKIQVVQKQQINHFQDWTNNFSECFPQTEVMTVDLILQLKKEDKDEQDLAISLDQSQQSCIYRCNGNLIGIERTEIQKKQLKRAIKQKRQVCRSSTIVFSNIYSLEKGHWNE